MSEETVHRRTLAQCEFSVRPAPIRNKVCNYCCFFHHWTASATPTLKALTNELKSVSDWHSLGVNLDLKRHQLSEIGRNYHGDDKRCKTEVLGCWLDNTTNPTWEAVAEALCLMDTHAVAHSIRRKYITSTTTTEGIVLLYSVCMCKSVVAWIASWVWPSHLWCTYIIVHCILISLISRPHILLFSMFSLLCHVL